MIYHFHYRNFFSDLIAHIFILNFIFVKNFMATASFVSRLTAYLTFPKSSQFIDKEFMS
jgi:hypothetical protein